MIQGCNGEWYQVGKNHKGEYTFWRVYYDRTCDYPSVIKTQIDADRFVYEMEYIDCDWSQYYPDAYDWYYKQLI